MLDKTDRKLKQFSSNGVWTFKDPALLAFTVTAKRGSLYEREQYFLFPVCESSDSPFTIFCMNHTKNARPVCGMPGQVGMVYQRYYEVEMKNKGQALRSLDPGAANYKRTLHSTLKNSSTGGRANGRKECTQQ